MVSLPRVAVVRCDPMSLELPIRDVARAPCSNGADAAPISQIQGSNWKTACQKAGGSMYGCCKSKETECRDGCQSGNSCGNACNQCKNQCSSSYGTCVAKVIKVPPGQKAPSSGTLKAD